MAVPMYKLPYLDVETPFKPEDIYISLLAVLLFLPVTVIVYQLIKCLCFRSKSKAE